MLRDLSGANDFPDSSLLTSDNNSFCYETQEAKSNTDQTELF